MAYSTPQIGDRSQPKFHVECEQSLITAESADGCLVLYRPPKAT